MKIRAFITHKKAESFSDCQDRFGVNNDTKSIAVSDGMGSTWQQKIWAQMLVESFISNSEWVPNSESVKELSPKWRQKVQDFIQDLKERNAPQNIIIRNERCLTEGRSAGATFVGIRFTENNWEGEVLGDSCLIEWDGKDAIFYTSQDKSFFDSFPDYFDSDNRKEGRGTPKHISGTLQQGRIIFLVSDPFSEFLLNHKNQGDIADCISLLLQITTHEEFENLVETWRNMGMHNDDTTLVVIEPDGSNDWQFENIDILDSLSSAEQAELEAKLLEEKKNEKIPESGDSDSEKKDNEIAEETISEIDIPSPVIDGIPITIQNEESSTVSKEFEIPCVEEVEPTRNDYLDRERFKSQVLSFVIKELDTSRRRKYNLCQHIFGNRLNKDIKAIVRDALDHALKEYDVIKKQNKNASSQYPRI